MSKATYDIVIVGSGIAAAVAASEALRRGRYKILMLEAGPDVVMRDERVWFDHVVTRRFPQENLYDRSEDYAATGVQAWEITGGRLMGRGGSTTKWGGWCLRQMPEDFSLRTNTGRELDWPYSYDDLEPYYCLAENWIGVAGDSSGRSRPRRSCPYPFEAPTFSQPDAEVIEAMEKLDIGYEHMPISRFGRPIHGRPACRTIGTCDYCPIGARFTGDQGLDRVGGDVELKLNSPVLEVVMATKTEVAGVRYWSIESGRMVEVQSECVWLCCGALEIPKLLMASRSQHWCNGIGNDADLVGRFLVANPFLYVSGVRSSNPGRIQGELGFRGLLSRHWDTPREQDKGKFVFSVSHPHLDVGAEMVRGKTVGEINDATVGEVEFLFQGGMQTLGFWENRVMAAEGSTRFGLPRTWIETPQPMMNMRARRKYLDAMQDVAESMGCEVRDNARGSYPQRGDHAMCTARMGSDPGTSVVDWKTLSIHGVERLGVFSNAVFPSGAAANPTLTMVAVIMKAFHEGGVRLPGE